MAAKSVASPVSKVDVRDSTMSPSGSHRPTRSTVLLRSPRGLLDPNNGGLLGGLSVGFNVPSIASIGVSLNPTDVAVDISPSSMSIPLVGPLPSESITLVGLPPPSSSPYPTGHPRTTTAVSTTLPNPQPPTTPSNSASQPNPNPDPAPNSQSTPSPPSPTATTETSTTSNTVSPSESGLSPTLTSSVASNSTGTALSRPSSLPGVWFDLTGTTTPTVLPLAETSSHPYAPSGGAKNPPSPDTPYLESPESPGSPASPTPDTPPNGAHPRGLSTGAIVGIALGAFAVVLCLALCLFLILRRRRRTRGRWRRMSVESARWRLKPYSYDDDESSRPVSSVWTAYGSVSVDPHFERESIADSLDFQFVEKPAPADACTPRGPSPSPSPAVAETQPLARSSLLSSSSVHTLRPPSLRLPAAASSSSSADLLALAGTGYAAANPFLDGTERGLERSVSGVSRTTAASGDVQSVEAL